MTIFRPFLALSILLQAVLAPAAGAVVKAAPVRAAAPVHAIPGYTPLVGPGRLDSTGMLVPAASLELLRGQAPAVAPGAAAAPEAVAAARAGVEAARRAEAVKTREALERFEVSGRDLDAAALVGDKAMLGVTRDGAVSLESAAGEGGKLFDMRRDQLAAQWPAVSAALERAAASAPQGGEAMADAVHAELARLKAAGAVAPLPGSDVRGAVRLDPELGVPLQGVSALLALAELQSSHPRLTADLFARLLAGYGRAIAQLAGLPLPAAAKGVIVNDVTQLNPVEMARVETPETLEALSALVAAAPGPVSVGGGRYSMGGQTAVEGGLQVDMRRMNKVLAFDPINKEISVQAGIRWRDIQEFIDPHNLSVKIMQTYNAFTVGGALSVNAHGRYMGLGPAILSVKSVKVVLADGSVVKASPTENAPIFYAAIGGYGAIGVIAEATLSLADNVKVERVIERMSAADYTKHFFAKVRPSAAAVFHNADFHGKAERATSVTYYETDKPLTVKARLRPTAAAYPLNRWVMYLITERPYGDLYRRLVDWLLSLKTLVVWRNYEASYDVAELEPASREKTTYVLQEYFVPVERFESFGRKMRDILRRHGANAFNVSIRHARKDPGSLLAWAREESFAYVLYYKQETSPAAKAEVAVWTRELIDAVLSEGGAYYLPYQIHATPEQFHAAYPRAKELFALKAKLDPTGKFTNKLWDAYYRPAAAQSVAEPQKERFKTVFGDVRLRDGFYKFLQNVYHLYPERDFHHLIWEETKKGGTDEDVYRRVQARLKEVKPFLGALRYALPSLSKQKKEMADQTRRLIGAEVKTVNGYVEVGTPGRYVDSLKARFDMKGPVYLVHEKEPGFGPEDVFERGGLRKKGKWLDIAKPIDAAHIPDASVDLVTVYIGLHHFPPKALDRFVKSMRRILRPGGRLVVRDHDAATPEMKAFVELAHDVYNAGLGLPWEENLKEYRKLTSNPELTAYLAERGFANTGKAVLQDNDPTLNTLIEYVKVERPGEDWEAAKHKRKPELTYLTVPEWYIVYSAREYASVLEKAKPSAFPYLGASKQFWREYKTAAALTRERFGRNKDAELMLWTIGVSFTAENVIKSVYENTVGRVTEWLSWGDAKAVDAYGAKVAREYADFVNHTPWYRFPFKDRLKGVWTRTPLFSSSPRFWERKLFLTMEYAGKAAMAWAMRKGAEAAYEPERLDTLVETDGFVPESVLAKDPRIQKLSETRYLVPRYGPFTEVAQDMLDAGVRLRSVAGNEDVVLTVLAPARWSAEGRNLSVLDAYPLLTEPGLKRVMLRAPVSDLGRVIGALRASDARIEHVYDF